MSESGSLIIISAPSGAGKTSLVNALLQNMENVQMSISHTTRQMRVGETNGVNYHFVDQSEFDEMLKQNAFLEHAVVFGNSYGTSGKWVSDTLIKGIDVILEIDWQGAEQIRKRISDTVSVFVLPPSESALLQRLTDRRQDNDHTIKERMAQAKSEVSHYNEYEYLIVNDDFATALEELKIILKASRLRRSRQMVVNCRLLEQLNGGWS